MRQLNRGNKVLLVCYNQRLSESLWFDIETIGLYENSYVVCLSQKTNNLFALKMPDQIKNFISIADNQAEGLVAKLEAEI